MKKFQYRIKLRRYNIEEETFLNEMGFEGWELCAYSSISGKYYFKREIKL